MIPKETKQDVEARKDREQHQRIWHQRMAAFIAAHAEKFDSIGYGHGTRVKDGVCCILIYTEERSKHFDDRVEEIFGLLLEERQDFVEEVSIQVVQEPRPVPWATSGRRL